MNRRRVDTFADTILFLALGARKEKQGWNRRVATRRRTSREGIQQTQQVVVDGDRRMSSRGEIKKKKGRKKKSHPYRGAANKGLRQRATRGEIVAGWEEWRVKRLKRCSSTTQCHFIGLPFNIFSPFSSLSLSFSLRYLLHAGWKLNQISTSKPLIVKPRSIESKLFLRRKYIFV